MKRFIDTRRAIPLLLVFALTMSSRAANAQVPPAGGDSADAGAITQSTSPSASDASVTADASASGPPSSGSTSNGSTATQAQPTDQALTTARINEDTRFVGVPSSSDGITMGASFVRLDTSEDKSTVTLAYGAPFVRGLTTLRLSGGITGVLRAGDSRGTIFSSTDGIPSGMGIALTLSGEHLGSLDAARRILDTNGHSASSNSSRAAIVSALQVWIWSLSVRLNRVAVRFANPAMMLAESQDADIGVSASGSFGRLFTENLFLGGSIEYQRSVREPNETTICRLTDRRMAGTVEYVECSRGFTTGLRRGHTVTPRFEVRWRITDNLAINPSLAARVGSDETDDSSTTNFDERFWQIQRINVDVPLYFQLQATTGQAVSIGLRPTFEWRFLVDDPAKRSNVGIVAFVGGTFSQTP